MQVCNGFYLGTTNKTCSNFTKMPVANNNLPLEMTAINSNIKKPLCLYLRDLLMISPIGFCFVRELGTTNQIKANWFNTKSACVGTVLVLRNGFRQRFLRNKSVDYLLLPSENRTATATGFSTKSSTASSQYPRLSLKLYCPSETNLPLSTSKQP